MIVGVQILLKEINIKYSIPRSGSLMKKKLSKLFEMNALRLKSEHACREEAIEEIYRQVVTKVELVFQ